MESALPLLLFLGGLFGMVILALTMGVLSRERERALEENNATSTLGAVEGPRFFLRPNAMEGLDPPTTVGTSTLELVEAHVRRERRVADRFVAQPSFERLFATPQGSVDELVITLEEYIRKERRHVADFVTDPSHPGWLEGNGADSVLPVAAARRDEAMAQTPWSP